MFPLVAAPIVAIPGRGEGVETGLHAGPLEGVVDAGVAKYELEEPPDVELEAVLGFLKSPNLPRFGVLDVEDWMVVDRREFGIRVSRRRRSCTLL